MHVDAMLVGNGRVGSPKLARVRAFFPAAK
jgi:hypothetical protein